MYRLGRNDRQILLLFHPVILSQEKGDRSDQHDRWTVLQGHSVIISLKRNVTAQDEMTARFSAGLPCNCLYSEECDRSGWSDREAFLLPGAQKLRPRGEKYVKEL